MSVIDVQADTGLIGIRGSCPPRHLSDMTSVIMMEIGRVMNREIGEVELARARNQLKSTMLFNLEHRAILLEVRPWQCRHGRAWAGMGGCERV